MKHTSTLFSSLFALLMIPFFIACGGGNTSSELLTGTLSLNLKDAPGDFQSVYVTIKEVQVHMSDNDSENSNTTDSSVAEDQNNSVLNGWKVVAAPKVTYDLLTLQNGVEAVLGEENLTVGHYTQMRLLLDIQADDTNNILDEAHPFANYVIIDGAYYEIIIPSGFSSGIKLIKGFDIYANTTTTLTLDFDAEKSVIMMGNGGWKLKPTIIITQD